MAVLEINNQEVDVSNKIVLSKKAYPFTNWFSRSVTFSQRVNIARLAFMKFGQYFSFKYKDNGKIVFTGNAILSSRNNGTNDDVQLLDKSKELFDLMKNELTSLELDTEDFIFNTAAYTTLKVLNSSIWLWSAANMHENRILANNILSGNLAFSRPFFSVKRLIEKIFSSNNWTYELSTNSELFDKLIISGSGKEFFFTSYEKKYNEDIVAAGSKLIDLTAPDFIKTDSLSGIDTLLLNYTSKLRFRGYINSTADMILQISGVSSLATDSQTETFVINAGRFYYDLTSNEYTTADTTYNLQFTLIGTGTATLEDFYIYTIINENDFGNISLANFTDFKVKTYDNVPKIKQIDLFKHGLVQIAGFYSTDNLRQKLNINSMNELSKLSALDWSEKYIENSDKKTQIKKYGKINYFNYDNDDSKPLNLGRGLFEIDNNTYPDTEDKYKSDFAASSEVVITDTMIDFPVFDDIEHITDANEIIGYYEDVAAYTVARFEQLNGNNVLLNYYQNFINSIINGDVNESDFYLNKSDFFGFGFINLIYIRQLKSTYYVIDIKNYIEGESSTLILLKAK